MSVNDEKLSQEFLDLTGDNQIEIEIEFGRLLQRYVEIYSQIDALKSIAADESGEISPQTFAMTDQKAFAQWRRENEEAVDQSPVLFDEFEDLFSKLGIEIGEDVDLWERDQMESEIGAELTDMYWNLSFASAISQSETALSEEDTSQNQGFFSKVRSNF